jgi:hypothetical protein
MAYTNIDDPSAYFQIALYTGTGSSLSVTNDGNSDLKPDILWAKNRDDTDNHHLHNTSIVNPPTRGENTNTTDVEQSEAQSFTAVATDGFTVGTWDQINTNTQRFVVWQWAVNNATKTTFAESGDNPGGTYQVNTTAGVSICMYTGTGAAGGVTHGLGVAPKFIMIKNRDVTDPWAVYYGDATDYLVLNTDAATVDNAAWWNDTAPSSTVFTVNTDHSVNADGELYIAYAFAEVQGYSKFSTYVGNGNVDGPFVYTGFKPAWLMIKATSASGGDGWQMVDNKRDPFNKDSGAYHKLGANSTSYESASTAIGGDLVSNGFKVRATDSGWNTNNRTYTYYAFAENPFTTSTGVPATAR